MNPSELSQGLGEIGVVIYVFFFKNRLFLAVLGLRCCTGFSLVVVSRGYLSSGHAQASHCGGFPCSGTQVLGSVSSSHYGTWAQWLQFPGSRAEAP